MGIQDHLTCLLRNVYAGQETTVRTGHGKLSSGHRTGKGQFHSNPKDRQCQGMLKISHNCIHLTHQQSNAQNSPSQASTICEHELPDV